MSVSWENVIRRAILSADSEQIFYSAFAIRCSIENSGPQ